MLNQKNGTGQSPPETDALIDELAQGTPDAIKKLRHHTRLSIRVKVIVEPASLSHRDGVRLQGVTGDISAGGTQILLARPLRIGDLYQVSFDREQLDLPSVFALCLRGRLVRPDAFEAGLRFLEPIVLPNDDPERKSIL
jgi:c-di-GMP-binding flagellar brake protein YcgR